MRLILTGGSGLLGSALRTEAERRGWTVDAPSRAEMDVTDGEAVRARVRRFRPDAVLHAAAYTAVDRAEEEPEEALRVNRDGTARVAEAAAESGARILCVSTDYVFDGRSSRPYLPDDPPAPLNAYGRSKRAGEEAALAAGTSALVVRTSWLYGKGGRDFVDAILEKGREERTLRVVSDQRGRPTRAESVAPGFLDLLASEETGILHWCDGGEASWHDFATQIVALSGLEAEVLPVSTQDVPRPAERPRSSVLDLGAAEAALRREPTHWTASLRAHLGRADAPEAVR